MGFTADESMVFEYLTTDAEWMPFISAMAPLGDRLFTCAIEVTARRKSDGASATWTQRIAFDFMLGRGMEIVGEGLSVLLTNTAFHADAAAWEVRARIEGDMYLIEGRAGPYEVEWRANGTICTFSSPPPEDVEPVVPE